LTKLSAENDDYHYELISHSDKRGSKSYNQKLSERRANSLKNNLIQLNSELEGKLVAFGKGETELKLRRNNATAHKVNRRVEIRVNCDA